MTKPYTYTYMGPYGQNRSDKIIQNAIDENRLEDGTPSSMTSSITSGVSDEHFLRPQSLHNGISANFFLIIQSFYFLITS